MYSRVTRLKDFGGGGAVFRSLKQSVPNMWTSIKMQINVNAIFGATGEDGNKFRYFQIKRWEIHKYQNTTFPPGEEACKILQIKKKWREYCEDDICMPGHVCAHFSAPCCCCYSTISVHMHFIVLTEMYEC